MGGIGNVSVITKAEESEVVWKINSFAPPSSLYYVSPRFYFEGIYWNLGIHDYGSSHNNSIGYIDLNLTKLASRSSMIVEFSFAFKILNGEKALERKSTEVSQGVVNQSMARFISRFEFTNRKSEFIVFESLTVICTLRRLESTDSQNRHESDVLSSKSGDDSSKLNSSDSEKVDEYKTPKAFEKLLDDFKSIMVSGEHSDITITVKGKEFRLHRSILCARCPYFNSMFNSNMREKNTGIVTIDDCEPDVFLSFIHYLYIGKADNLSFKSVCDLYEISNKYQEDLLKEECLRFMMNSISVESFINFMILALTHNEEELLKKATKFFANNTKEIIRDVKWLTFLKEYPVYANELHITALDVHKALPDK